MYQLELDMRLDYHPGMPATYKIFLYTFPLERKDVSLVLLDAK
jgi:hypothetical protein